MGPADEPTEDAGDYFIPSDRDTGFWLSADALLWKRNNSGGSGPIIGGPESLRFGDDRFHFEGGYRLGAG